MPAGVESSAEIGIALAAYQPNLTTFYTQLLSIQEQSFEGWKCFVTFDSSLEPVSQDSRFDRFFKDSRFLFQENSMRLGHKKNFERAARLAAELNWICFSDQDDIWYQDKLQALLTAIQSKPAMAVVHSDMDILVQERVIEKSAWALEKRGVWNVRPQDLLIRNVVAGCALIMDSQIARFYPDIPPEFEYHDHWFPFVASCRGGVYPLYLKLYAYRQHGGNVLGVTPYEGLFSHSSGKQNTSLLKKATALFQGDLGRFSAAERVGLNQGLFNRWLIKAPFDFGALYALKGFCALWSRDVALARACFARAIGKAFSVL